MARKPLGTEAAECYTLDMQRLAPISYGVPGAGRIKVPDFDVPYLLVHNHPNGGPFSIGDIRQVLARPNLQLVTAVGNNGLVYEMEKTVDFDGIKAELSIQEAICRHPGWKGEPEEHLKAVLEFFEEAKTFGLRYIAPEN